MDKPIFKVLAIFVSDQKNFHKKLEIAIFHPLFYGNPSGERIIFDYIGENHMFFLQYFCRIYCQCIIGRLLKLFKTVKHKHLKLSGFGRPALLGFECLFR